ncbi:phosphatase PAP2 family protein, partial [Acinetobacter baumannii]
LELALLGAAYAGYAWIRDRQGDDQSPAAFARAVTHGQAVVRLEHATGIGRELGIQRALLAVPWLVRFFDVFYATAHVPVTLAV